MSLKLIHTGDVHIGAKFSFLGEKGKLQREQIKKTFEKVVDFAIDQKADALLIAGDLFDNTRPSEYSISFVKSALERLVRNNIYTVIIPGTHDRLESDSVFQTTDFSTISDKVIVFKDPEVSRIEVPELDTTFYANPNVSNKSRTSPLKELTATGDSTYHIALAHGSFQIEGKSAADDYPITLDDVQNSKMNYMALAHWHNPFDVTNGKNLAWYCGSPEIVASDQKESGKVLVVELTEDAIQVAPHTIGRRKILNIELDVAKFAELNDLIKAIEEYADSELILNIELKGVRDSGVAFDVDKLTEQIFSKFFALNIRDHSVVDLAVDAEDGITKGFIIDKFIEQVKSSELDDSQKREILSIGIQLLEGRDIL